MIDFLRSRAPAPEMPFCVEVDPKRHKEVRDDVLAWAASDENCGGCFRIELREPRPNDDEYRVIYTFDKPENAVDMRVRFG
jgi:hypothetical protein